MDVKRSFLFASKRVAVYPATVRKVNDADIRNALERNARCDWGEIGNEEWLSNDEAYKAGRKTVAMYTGYNSVPLVVVTEPETSTIRIFPDSTYGQQEQRAC